MKTAVLIHGWDSKEDYFNPDFKVSASDAHWFPWLRRQLILKDILAQAPEMPHAWEPDYKDWSKMLERFDLNEDTTLVGFSCGGGFLLRYLSEHKINVGKVVLVAPWIDPDNILKSDFFKFEIDPELASRTSGLTVMYSTNDYPDIVQPISLLRSKLTSADFIEFSDKGHFTESDLKANEFPELLDALLN